MYWSKTIKEKTFINYKSGSVLQCFYGLFSPALEVFLCKQGLCLSNSPRSAAFWYSREIINHDLWHLDMPPWELSYHKYSARQCLPAPRIIGRTLIGPDFKQRESWFSMFAVKMILRDAMDSLLLNMSGLGELPVSESHSLLRYFWWTDEKFP